MSALAMEFLVWVDLETTGLDAEMDWIVEFAFVVTTAVKPFDEVDRCCGLVKPPGDWRTRANEIVKHMHEQSGLAAALDAAEYPITWWDQEVSAWLSEFDGEKMLAGSGVARFDRWFLTAQMSRTMACLRYDELDVGVMRRALRLLGYELPAFTKPHRAEEDVEVAIEQWRIMADLLTEAGGW